MKSIGIASIYLVYLLVATGVLLWYMNKQYVVIVSVSRVFSKERLLLSFS